MPRYKYAGPGPVPDPEGGIVRPGDTREFAEEPVWGPWEALDKPEDTPAAESSGPVSVALPAAAAGLKAPSPAEPAKEM